MSEENFEQQNQNDNTDFNRSEEQGNTNQYSYNQQMNAPYGQNGNQYNYNQQTGPQYNQQTYQTGANDSWKQQYTNPGMNGMNPQKPKTENAGFGIASMVLGIVSLVLFCSCINIPLAIAAIVFAIIQMVKSNKKGMAIAGLITGVASLVCGIVFWILIFTGTVDGFSYNYSFPNGYEHEYHSGEDFSNIMDDIFEHNGNDTI